MIYDVKSAVVDALSAVITRPESLNREEFKEQLSRIVEYVRDMPSPPFFSNVQTEVIEDGQGKIMSKQVLAQAWPSGRRYIVIDQVGPYLLSKRGKNRVWIRVEDTDDYDSEQYFLSFDAAGVPVRFERSAVYKTSTLTFLSLRITRVWRRPYDLFSA